MEHQDRQREPLFPEKYFTPLPPEIIEPKEVTEKKVREQIAALKARSWTEDIKSHSSDDADHEKSDVMMHSVVNGIVSVVDTTLSRKKIPPNYRIPEVRVVDDSESGGYPTYRRSLRVEPDGTLSVIKSEILIPVSVLEEHSGMKQATTYRLDIDEAGGKVVGEAGTPTQLSYNVGAEEVAHSIYDYGEVAKGVYHPEMGEDDLEGVTLAHYDARPDEYHGLGWQVRSILDSARRGEITKEEADTQVAPLRERIRKAAKWRYEKRKSRTAPAAES